MTDEKRLGYARRAVERSHETHMRGDTVSWIGNEGLYAGQFATWQCRHAKWQAANFPPAGPALFALGVAEEALLELDRALEDLDGAGVDDALGDASVFLMGLCTHIKLDWGTLWQESIGYKPHPVEKKRGLQRAVGRLCQVALKAEQKIRGLGDPDAARLALGGAVLEVMCWLRRETQWVGSEDKDEAVRRTLEVVLQRVTKTEERPV